MNTKEPNNRNFKALLLLSLGALGVVYGDIGTSPLYAINEMFFGHAHIQRQPDSILGVISLVFWAITIIISFKYVVYVLRADNDGEGGVFALVGLLTKKNLRAYQIIIPLLIFAAGLLYGDGIITPAISVLSAIEGLKVATHTFEPYIVPITIAILTGLFMIQSKGTAKIGTFFGPIISVWFVAIASIGVMHISQNPQILQALNPLHAISFLVSHPIHQILLTLGSVMLVVTGGEAMYADMGHFGARPIRWSWFTITYPALILNYLGQGAYLLSQKQIVSDNIFFSMVPTPVLIPMVFLATLATIIASQALISGAFSLTSQAVSLGLIPYIKTINTHKDHEGQRYIPGVNWALYIGCVLLVLSFRTSTNLASAYGLAVSGVMFMTSIAMIGVSRYFWNWSKLKCFSLFVPLAIIDFTFLSANSLKIFQGGYIPVCIAVVISGLMLTWQWGRAHIKQAFTGYKSMTLRELITFKETNKSPIDCSIVIMTPTKVVEERDEIPLLQKIFIDRYNGIPKHIIFLTVITERKPYVHNLPFIVNKLYSDPVAGSISSVTLRFGFMEELDVEARLEDLAHHHRIHIDENPKEWLVHALQERVALKEGASLFDQIKFLIFQFLSNNSQSADEYFGLGKDVSLSLEVFPVKI